MSVIQTQLAIKGFGPELSTYQVGAHFEALDEGVLMAPLKSSEQFFRHFNFPCRTVVISRVVGPTWKNLEDEEKKTHAIFAKTPVLFGDRKINGE